MARFAEATRVGFFLGLGGVWRERVIALSKRLCVSESLYWSSRFFVGMGGSMPKPQRFCIYCGGAGLTHEHLFADWLRAYIPRELSEHRSESVIAFPHKTNRTLKRQTGDTHARRLRRVCETCKLGWMSDLQEAAKPYLVPMLEGKSISLNRKAQKIVAAWVAMTTMTAEYLDDKMVAVPQSERDYLRETSQAPKTWRIWIARYNGAKSPKRLWHNAMALTDQKVEGAALYAPAPSNTQTTAISLGDHLFIYVMSSEIAWNLIRRWRLPPTVSSLFRQICPAAAAKVVWPPGRPLTFPEADFIADQFFNRLLRSARKAVLLTPPPG